MSTRLPPRNVSCPRYGEGVIFSGNTPEMVSSLWRTIARSPGCQTASATCCHADNKLRDAYFGVLGPCALIAYGGIRLVQSGYVPIAVGAVRVLFVIHRLLSVLQTRRRKP